MIKKISCYFLFLLAFSIYAVEEKVPLISNAEELNDVKAKKIVWQKDKSVMVAIPSSNNTKNFWMDITEVTVGQFKRFLELSNYETDEVIKWNDVHKYSPTDKNPMICISWNDAMAYAKWVGKRLPTEKEWEFAARGGLIGKEYSWGNDEQMARHYANIDGIGGKDRWGNETAPVGSFNPNGYGLYDMAGNTWEWCENWYDSSQSSKVSRGGSWVNNMYNIRVVDRIRFASKNWDFNFGFRCVSGPN